MSIMKKAYNQPAMRVVEMKQRQILCGSDYSVNSLSTNLGDDTFDLNDEGSNGAGR